MIGSLRRDVAKPRYVIADLHRQLSDPHYGQNLNNFIGAAWAPLFKEGSRSFRFWGLFLSN